MDPCSQVRELALAELLDAVVVGRAHVLLGSTDCDASWAASLEVLRRALTLQWDDGVALAAIVPPAAADDAPGRWLRRGAVVWAAAGDPGPESDRVLDGVLDDLPDVSDPLGRFAGYLLVEGTLAHARLDLAAQLVERLGPDLWAGLHLGGRAHPMTLMTLICRARVLAFRGELTGAAGVLRDLPPAPGGPLAAVVAATSCLVHGNEADPVEVRRLVAVVDAHAPSRIDLLGAGSQMLAAFGLIAVGDVAGAARRVLLAGGDADLERLDVIDRALGLELLVAFAIAADDLDAAQTWADRAAPLLASPIADSTVARISSRVALAEGRVDDAVAWGERAVARARTTDRVIEYAEGEIVLNRARMLQDGAAAGDGGGDRGRRAAVRALEAMVAEAELRGHRAARRSAARELRPAGLRLRPLAGSGWAGLSEREAEVGRAVVEGASNREVAVLLHLSEHTVRAHVSRVLAAFGVATRSALPAAAGVDPVPEPAPGTALTVVRPALTPRQRDVALLVGEGLTNRAISERLGLSPRTVENHVADILVRWDLPGRTAIARIVSDER